MGLNQNIVIPPKNGDIKYQQGLLWYYWAGKWCLLNLARLIGGGVFNNGGGGGSVVTGIQVQDEGVDINGLVTTINFIGQLVTAAAGAGRIDITVKIPSMTTAQRTALIPTTALIVEDTDLDQYFKWSTVSSSWSPI